MCQLLAAVVLTSCALIAAEPKWEAAKVLWQTTMEGSVGQTADGGLIVSIPITNLPAPPQQVPDHPGGMPTATTYLRVSVGDFIYEWEETGSNRIVTREGDLLRFYRDKKKIIVVDDRNRKHEFKEIGKVPKLP